MTMPRMRTAAGVLAEIKKVDPSSEVSLYYIRRLIQTEAVPVVNCGKKKLVNVDAVMELLANGYDKPMAPERMHEPVMEYGIRRVK